MIDQIQALTQLILVAQSVACEDGPGHDRLRAALRSVHAHAEAEHKQATYHAALTTVLALAEREGDPRATLGLVRTLVRDTLFAEIAHGPETRADTRGTA